MQKNNALLTGLILFFGTNTATAMKRPIVALDTATNNRSETFFNEFRTLLPELQKHILLSHDAIFSLGHQPITLAGPNKHTNNIYCTAINGDKIVTAAHDNTVKIWHAETGEFLRTLSGAGVHLAQITSMATNGDKVITASWDTIRAWNIDTGKLLGTQFLQYTGIVRTILVSGNLMIIGTTSGITLYDIRTGKPLHYFGDHHEIICGFNQVTINENWLVTSSEGCTAKIWPLSLNLKGTPDDNLFLWIMYKADMPLLDLINRACQATSAKKEFILALPKKLNVIQNNESQEQMDGRTYCSLLPAVREYLRARLNFRR